MQTHVAQQRYLVTPTGLAWLKGLDLQKKLDVFIIEIFNKKGLKI
jgi:hypothetical protein